MSRRRNMRQAVEILDTTLRDGSYAIDFQFTAEDTALVASALESAGIGLVEVAHGLGLGAARAGKGDQADTDEAYLRAAASVLTRARFGAFFIPGIGKEDDLRLAADCGVHFVRVGTNVTEVAQAEPYVKLAKALGFTVFSNLMKSYAVSPAGFAQCARLAESFGADIVCLVDSAGGMLPEDIREYVTAARQVSSVRLGFHGHDNLAMAVANALAAYDAGAEILDTSLQGLGRSEGNVMTEVLAAVLQRRGLLTHINVNGLLDISEAFIRPLLRSKGRSGLGITSGRARFHSSFLGGVLRAAAQCGVDPRDLILELGEREQVNAPPDLLQQIASELAGKEPPRRVRVDIASVTAEVPAGFWMELGARARELKEQSCKLGRASVLNVVVTPYELTHVSPYVETNYGNVLSCVMLAEPDLLVRVLEAVDGQVHYVLCDPNGRAVPAGTLKKSVLLTYVDHEMWARATVSQLTVLMEGSVAGKCLAVTGVPRLAARAALALGEGGAEVLLDSRLASDAGALCALCPRVSVRPLAEAASIADAVVSLSPRRPAVGPDLVMRMRPGALLYDGGIGSLEPDAVPIAEQRGIRVVRVDMRPSLAAAASELIGMKRIVDRHMGRAVWNGVSIVAGGLIGRKDEVIVDSVTSPSRVIGTADGRGGILCARSDDPAVRAVRCAIAEKQLQGHGADSDV
jgi:4-hydroxy 2-oxovalerate aldolase/long-chain acyl-CoA synthetase